MAAEGLPNAGRTGRSDGGQFVSRVNRRSSLEKLDRRLSIFQSDTELKSLRRKLSGFRLVSEIHKTVVCRTLSHWRQAHGLAPAADDQYPPVPQRFRALDDGPYG